MRPKLILSLFSLIATLQLSAQTFTAIRGSVKDNNNVPLQSVTVSLLKAADSSLVKADITDKKGAFEILCPCSGKFLLSYSATGYNEKYSSIYAVDSGKTFTSPPVALQSNTQQLQNVTVVSHKPLIEIKADKLVFNVENSINATGSNALELLQKSPGVMVDNNDNISMKGKSGVKIYIDGRMTQLDSKSLADYLRSINSNDIEAIEMISNPSAKYDASGNAGIINIRLKKNKKFGTNGSASVGYVQGITPKENGSLSLNYRNKKINLFSNLSGNLGNNQSELDIYRIQSDSIYNQHTMILNKGKSANVKAGVDYSIDNKNTIGFLVTFNFASGSFNSNGNTVISYQPTDQYIKTLVSSNYAPNNRTNADFNINYRYEDTSGKEIGFDGDYGLFRSRANSYQPNYYYGDNTFLYSIINGNSTPTNIDIYTAKLDVEQKLWKGKFGYGAKFSYVKTNNTFDFFDYTNNIPVKDPSQSNSFVYTENVNAAYINYNRSFKDKWSLQAGLRTEQTNSEGDLTRADGISQPDDTVKRSYFDLFPSAAISYNLNDKNTFGLTYSRRIDRPTYQDLNPFENKLDQLTYEKGNAFLRPQYTDNIEISHTVKSKLITSLSYSYVKDYATQITDTTNGNATYVQQQNIASQQLYSFNMGSPLSPTKWWNGYANIWYNYQQIKGAYNNVVVNISQTSDYGAYMQNSFTLGKDYTAELTGWFNGPGLEGTWQRKAMGGMEAGIQKLFLQKKATVRLSATDILRTLKFRATSDYGGTNLNIYQYGEQQTIRLNFSYRFGSNQIKGARERKTGLESESNRIKTQ
jgi:iron complex outermembrane receptor protein